MSNPYVESWQVEGTSGKTYKVSRREHGSFACECLAWKFQKAPKRDCQHILKIMLQLASHPVTIALGSPDDYEVDPGSPHLPKRRIRT